MATEIKNDIALLKAMMDSYKFVSSLYTPGPYWLPKIQCSAQDIEKFGLADFRGWSSNIGTSYTDNVVIDRRGDYRYGLRSRLLGGLLEKVPPIARAFDSQVHLTKAYFKDMLACKSQLVSMSPQVQELLDKYKMPADTTRGGCVNVCHVNGKVESNHYLEQLFLHDVLAKHINFKAARSFFEIGGGFGANVHLLLENYENIRKVIYLDIPPNLYVATQYLQSFYGDCVKTYTATKDMQEIRFQDDETLEIICIAPYQIEALQVQIDIFQNANSFVEMPEAVSKNYAEHVERLLSESGAIGLASYGNFNLETTYHPDKLPDLFPSRKFKTFQEARLLEDQKTSLFYIGT